MADLKQLESKLNDIGHLFLISSEKGKDTASYCTYKNKLAAKMWCYAEEFRKIKYSDIEEYDFEEVISDTILSCLEYYKKGDSIVNLFKTVLKRNLFKFLDIERQKGMEKISNEVVRLGRELEKWAEWKGVSYDFNRRNREMDEKLYAYGRSWGKSDAQIKKALDWLDKQNILEGNKSISDDVEDELFDTISVDKLVGFENDSDIRKKKLLLYIKAANDEYLEKKDSNLIFYSEWYTNLLLAAMIKCNIPNLDIAKTLRSLDITDKTVFSNFINDKNWEPNTDRKSIGKKCGIKENSIGNVGDRFKNAVKNRYEKLLEKADI